MSEEKNLQKRVEEELKSGTHKTLEDAIDSAESKHEKKVETYSFFVFDMNDLEGKSFKESFRKPISYTSDLELQGELGKIISKYEDDMVYFFNEERGKAVLEKLQQWNK